MVRTPPVIPGMEMAGGVFILAKGVNQMPNNVTPEQIARAKEVNILDYVLSHEPNNVKRIGNTHYLKDHDSFRISNFARCAHNALNA